MNNATGWSEGKTLGNLGDLLFFAPRYLQSRLTTLANGIRGLQPGASLEHRLARQSMQRLISQGTMLTVGLNAMLGQETDFRPFLDKNFQPSFTPSSRKNPNFQRVRAFGRDFSVFGPWDSIGGAIISTAGGSPDAFRGLSSGPVSIAWDLISGRSFKGEEVARNPVEDPVGFGSYLLSAHLPFSTDEAGDIAQQIGSGILEGDAGEVGAGLVAGAGEIFGVKSSPLSASEEEDIVIEEVMAEMRQDGVEMDPGGFREQAQDVQDHILDDDRVGEKTKEKLQVAEDRGSPYQAYRKERAGLETQFLEGEGGLNALVDRLNRSRAGQLEPGEKPLFGKAFRARLGVIQRDLSRDKDSLRNRKDSVDALAFLEDLDAPTHEFDIALDTYIKAITDPLLEDPVTGTYNFDEKERRIEAMRDDPNVGPEMVLRIQDHLNTNDPPIIKQLRADQEIMAPYFQLTSGFMEFLQTDSEFKDQFKGLGDQFDEYHRVAPAQRELEIKTAKFVELRKAFSLLDSRVGKFSQRQVWLMNNDPEIDRLLVKWGYRDRATHPDVVKEQEDVFVETQEGLVSR